MANEIDLYNDLQATEEMLARAKHANNKLAIHDFKMMYKRQVKEIKELYPELAL